MIFYILILFVLLSLKNKYILPIFVILVGGVCALRYNIGYDYSNYLTIILGNNTYDAEFDRFEPLSRFLILLSRKLHFSQFFFITTSFVTIGSIAFFIKSESLNKKMSILIFMSLPLFFWASLSIIRQMCAVSLGTIYFLYLFQKKYVKASFPLTLAILFHSSAWILLPAIIIKRIHLNNKKIVFVYILSFFLYILIPLFLRINTGVSFIERAQFFMMSTEELKGYKGLFYLVNFIFIFLLFILKKHLNNEDENKEKLAYYFKLFVTGTIIYNIFSPFATLGGRLSTFYLITLIIILPNIIELSNNKIVKYLTYTFSCIIFVYTIWLASSSYQNGLTAKDPYCPYRTFLSNQKEYYNAW